MDSIRVIDKYYRPGSLAYQILLTHSLMVTHMAKEIAGCMGFSVEETAFIEEGAMLHDIGIFYTAAPDIGCFGDLPYICHGYKGHDLLLSEGLPKHALVCERHTGTGLTMNDISSLGGVLPCRPMEPVSLAEKLIAYCDKFYSKDPRRLEEKQPIEEVVRSIRRFGEEKVIIFKQWHQLFNS